MGSKLAVLVNIKEAAINRASLGNFYKVEGISISSFTFHSNKISIFTEQKQKLRPKNSLTLTGSDWLVWLLKEVVDI